LIKPFELGLQIKFLLTNANIFFADQQPANQMLQESTILASCHGSSIINLQP